MATLWQSANARSRLGAFAVSVQVFDNVTKDRDDQDHQVIRRAESAAKADLVTTAPDAILLTENGEFQALVLAESITSMPDLIVSSPFKRVLATALPTVRRYPDVPFELWAAAFVIKRASSVGYSFPKIRSGVTLRDGSSRVAQTP
jgi:hypothetical protein